MRDHRQAGDRVQDLRQRALHARALARGKDDRQAASLAHDLVRVRRLIGISQQLYANFVFRATPARLLQCGRCAARVVEICDDRAATQSRLAMAVMAATPLFFSSNPI
jgi:hypothetical protein